MRTIDFDKLERAVTEGIKSGALPLPRINFRAPFICGDCGAEYDPEPVFANDARCAHCDEIEQLSNDVIKYVDQLDRPGPISSYHMLRRLYAEHGVDETDVQIDREIRARRAANQLRRGA